MPPRKVILGSLLALLLAGCGDAANEGSITDPGARLNVTEDLRLGALDDAEQNFNGRESVVIGPAGELIVADPRGNRIRVFGEDGQYLRTIGAPGSGPGHFETLVRVTLRGDTLLAHDASPKISAFTLDGRFQRLAWGPGEPWMFSLSDPAVGRVMYMSHAAGSLSGDSTVIAKANYGHPANQTCETGERGTVLHAPYLRLDRAGRIADTLYWQAVDSRSLIVDGDGAKYVWKSPIAAAPQVDFLPEGKGLLIAEESALDGAAPPTIRLTALGAGRDTLWHRELPVQPMPVTEQHFELAVSRMPPVALPNCGSGAAPDSEPPTTAELMDAYRDIGRMPSRLPAVTGLHVGQDGSIWLRREEAAADSIAWQLLDAGGEPRGFVRLPSGQTIIAARGDTFIATELDELDVPYLIRYRLAGR